MSMQSDSSERWRKQNMDKARKHARDSYQRRKEKIKTYQKEYRKENIERISERDNEYNKKYWKEHREEVWDKHLKRREKDPRRFILNRIKARAKKKGILFNLELEDIVIPDVCPVLGIPLSLGTTPGAKNPYDFCFTVDRMVPELGYTKGNITIMSGRANRFKNDSTLAELKQLCEWWEKLNDKD